MVSSKDHDEVDFAKNEVGGVEYYKPLLVLLKDLHLHNALASAWLSGDASFKDGVAAKSADLANDIKNLDDVNQRLGAAMSADEKWKARRPDRRGRLRHRADGE